MSDVPVLPKEIFRHIMWWRAALQLYQNDSDDTSTSCFDRMDFHNWTRDLRNDPGVSQYSLDTDLLQYWIEARWMRSAKRRKKNEEC